MTCTQCGWEIEDARACPVCGATQDEALASSDDDAGPEDAPDGPPPWTAEATGGVRGDTARTTPPPPPPPAPGPQAPAWPAAPVHSVAPHPSGLSSDVRTFAMLTHLSAFAAAAIGFSFIGPLVLWLIKREEHPFIEHHGREALNFNLSLLLYSAIGFVLALVTLGFGLILVLPAAIVVGILWIVFTILAAVKANNGEGYRYPLTIRFINR